MSPVTGLARLPGRILWCVHMENFNPVGPGWIQETQPKRTMGDKSVESWSPGHRAGVFIWEIFIPVTEISVAKTEISVTGPARPLIWTHRYFYKEKSGQARSLKPSQPGRPGSYEEALRNLLLVYWILYTYQRFRFRIFKLNFCLGNLLLWWFADEDCVVCINTEESIVFMHSCQTERYLPSRKR